KELSGEELTLLKQQTERYRHGRGSSIVGRVTLDTDIGELHAPPGVEVFISPVTTFTAQRFDEYVLKKNEPPTRVEAQLYYSTRTDERGRFKFVRLASGDYFLVTQVFWMPPGSDDPKGELAYARVHVGPDETLEATVTRDVRS